MMPPISPNPHKVTIPSHDLEYIEVSSFTVCGGSGWGRTGENGKWLFRFNRRGGVLFHVLLDVVFTPENRFFGSDNHLS
jgi:hypothetical protein